MTFGLHLPSRPAEFRYPRASTRVGQLEQPTALAIIVNAGFRDVRVAKSRRIDLPKEALVCTLAAKDIAAAREADLHVKSVTVVGVKPANSTGAHTALSPAIAYRHNVIVSYVFGQSRGRRLSAQPARYSCDLKVRCVTDLRPAGEAADVAQVCL